jgi:hypothetical protein
MASYADGTLDRIPPTLNPGEKEHVLVVQDESIFHTNCHCRYGQDTETLSRKCKSRAEGLIHLSMSLSSKFLSLWYARETLQKRESRM